MKNSNCLKLYGVPRSGGTLVYNIVRELLSGKATIEPQTHSFFDDSEKAIITYRDFRDCVVSSWRVGNHFDSPERRKLANYSDLTKTINDYKRQVAEHLNQFKNKRSPDKTLYLKYEDWVNNYDFLFGSLQDFLEIDVSKKQRQRLRSQYSREEVKKQTKKLETEGFDAYDKLTHFHGHHIYTGRPGTWKELVWPWDHEKLTNALKNELESWDYI